MFFLEAEFWVFVAFVIFVAIVWKVGGFKSIVGGLDARAERIRAELGEAQRLREEAAGVLAEYQRKREAAEREAADIVAAARADERDGHVRAHGQGHDGHPRHVPQHGEDEQRVAGTAGVAPLVAGTAPWGQHRTRRLQHTVDALGGEERLPGDGADHATALGGEIGLGVAKALGRLDELGDRGPVARRCRGEMLVVAPHLPEEPGFWETSHYEPGGEPPPQANEDLVVVDGGAVRDRDDQVPQLGIAAEEFGVRHDREIVQFLSLAGEPALVT